MKKLLVLLAVTSSLIFTNCTNENTVNPKSEIGKATVTGFIRAQLDETTGVEELAPSGTKVVAIISTKDLVLTADDNVNYADKYYETTVDGSGKYTVEVEVGNRSLDVTVVPADFAADVKTGGSAFEKRNFYGSNAKSTVEVYKNGTFLLDLSY